jgi:hypothetical protein
MKNAEKGNHAFFRVHLGTAAIGIPTMKVGRVTPCAPPTTRKPGRFDWSWAFTARTE